MRRDRNRIRINRLILSLEPLVKSLARNFTIYPTALIRQDDLESEAWLGAIEAVETFDRSCGASLETWGHIKIRKHLKRYCERCRVDRNDRQRQQVSEGTSPPIMMTPLYREDGTLISFHSDGGMPQVIAAADVSRLMGRAGLSSWEKRILHQCYFEGLTGRESAKGFGLSEVYLSQRKHVALRKLAACL